MWRRDTEPRPFDTFIVAKKEIGHRKNKKKENSECSLFNSDKDLQVYLFVRGYELLENGCSQWAQNAIFQPRFYIIVHHFYLPYNRL
jgi:hypothetical protein